MTLGRATTASRHESSSPLRKRSTRKRGNNSSDTSEAEAILYRKSRGKGRVSSSDSDDPLRNPQLSSPKRKRREGESPSPPRSTRFMTARCQLKADHVLNLARSLRTLPGTTALRSRHTAKRTAPPASSSALEGYVGGTAALATMKSSGAEGALVKLHAALGRGGSREKSTVGRQETEKLSEQDAAAPGASSTSSAESDSDEERERAEHHRNLYKTEFMGLEAFGSSGLTKLELLLTAAMTARERCHSLARVLCGAAALTSAGNIFSAFTMEKELQGFDLCAEKGAVLAALGAGQTTIEALAVCSDSYELNLVPCGSCREFLSRYGDYPVYLVRSDMQYIVSSSSALFPRAKEGTLGSPSLHMVNERVQESLGQKVAQKESKPLNSAGSAARRYDEDGAAPPEYMEKSPYDWTTAEVGHWIGVTLKFPELRSRFEDQAIDGALLLQLQEDDLRVIFKVKASLHRRQILRAIDALRDRDLLTNGIDSGQLEDYLAILDRDRVELVSRLKEVFDKFDPQRQGTITVKDVSKVFAQLGCDASSIQATTWLQKLENEGKGMISFIDFARGFSDLALKRASIKQSKPVIDLRRAREVFDRVDVNKDGKHSLEEVENLLRALQVPDPKEEAKRWMAVRDQDGSGSVTFSEFILHGLKANNYHRLPLLSSAFQKLDQDGDGYLSLHQVRGCLKEFLPMIEDKEVDEWCRSLLSKNVEKLSLADFALFCYDQLEGKEEEKTRKWAADGKEMETERVIMKLIERETLPHRRRIELLEQSGHVRLRPRREEEQGKRERYLAEDREKRRRTAEERAEAHLKKLDEDEFPSSLRSVEELITVRVAFDRFMQGKDQKITGMELVQALTELGTVAPRAQIVRYLKALDISMGAREIDFYQFLTAYVALKPQDPLVREKNVPQYKGKQQKMKSRRRETSPQATKRKAEEDVLAAKLQRKEEALATFKKELAARMERAVRGAHKERADKRMKKKDQHHRSPSRRRKSSSPESDRSERRTRKDKRGGKRRPESSPSSSRSSSPSHRRHSYKGTRRRSSRRDEHDGGRRRQAEEVTFGSWVWFRRNGDREKKAIVLRETGDQCFDIALASGKVVEDVPIELLSLLAKERKSRGNSPYTSNSPSAKRKEDPKRGSKKRSGPNSHDEKERSKKAFKDGQKIEAQVSGSSKYLKGRILRCHDKDLYDIKLDNGDTEKKIPGSRLRAGEAEDTEEETREKERRDRGYEEGDTVEVELKRFKKRQKGKVIKCRTNGTYDVEFEDGETELKVAADLVHPVRKKDVDTEDDDRKKQGKRLEEGDTVEAQFKGGSKFYKGKITRCRVDGTYDIEYEDGDKEQKVPAEKVRPLPAEKKKKSTSEDDDELKKDKKASSKLEEGDKVEAQFKGGSKFYKGKITRCRVDGTYDIEYEDGDKEQKVPAAKVRPLGQEKKRSKVEEDDPKEDKKGSLKLEEGDKVEAQFKGGSKFYKGKVIRCRVDGTYDIEYEDGDKEQKVPAEKIRPLEQEKKNSKSEDAHKKDKKGASKLEEGDKVEAQFKGGSKFYKGKITRCRVDGTYDIEYEDGDKEQKVAAEKVRPLEQEKKESESDVDDPKKDQKASSKLEEGDKVEAQFKGGSKFYKGKITRCRVDGTYDIEYEDGDKEQKVPAEKIRSIEVDKKSKITLGDEDEPRKKKKEPKLEEGDKVEVQFKGGSKFYKGKITRCRVDGTYDIEYEDGDKEQKVPAGKVRPLEQEKKKSKVEEDDPKKDKKGTSKFEEGDKVEAQFKGGSKFYKGKIIRCRVDGTYDIEYEDGDKEQKVPAEKIRSIEVDKKKKITSEDEEEPKKKIEPKLEEGDKVEAQFKGGSKFYKGKITRCRVDGTYDIEYEDGDKEQKVPAEKIRPIESDKKKKKASEDEDEREDHKKEPSLEEGDKVEAQFKGGSKFYKGKVTRCRVDGTYDIEYEDGDKEQKVPLEKIRIEQRDKTSRSEDEKEPKKKKETPLGFKEGEKVEAQFKGGSKFYKGKITRCRVDGTYDIEYEDGDKEQKVPGDRIRRP